MNYVTCYSCLYDNSFITEERQESENKTKEHLLIQMLMKNIDTNVIKPVWMTSNSKHSICSGSKNKKTQKNEKLVFQNIKYKMQP